jgi:hypothetical protein
MDFKLFMQQKHVAFYENTCSIGELDEKSNHKKDSKFQNFERSNYKAKDFLKKPFGINNYVQ